VSEYIRELPFLWVNVDDEPGPESDRAYIERNAIALVSNFESEPIDRGSSPRRWTRRRQKPPGTSGMPRTGASDVRGDET